MRADLSGFEVVRPRALDEVLARLAEGGWSVLAGGTDLMVTLGALAPGRFVDVWRVDALRGITVAPDAVTLGALTTYADVQRHPLLQAEFPMLVEAARRSGAAAIQNRGTLGGNIANASPIGDLAPVLLALGATVELRSAAGARAVPIDEFFLAYRKTALRPGEVLAAVELPDIPGNARAAAYKVSKRRELDISTVGAGFYVELDAEGRVHAARLAYGGMAATPARARHIEAALVGKPWSIGQVEAALPALAHDFRPIDDLRGSAWYRATVAANLLRGFALETQRAALPNLSQRPSGTVHLEVVP
jgi:xanthine dehydrogenase iron-sulfur cluster and FAD-binding subunit A